MIEHKWFNVFNQSKRSRSTFFNNITFSHRNITIEIKHNT